MAGSHRLKRQRLARSGRRPPSSSRPPSHSTAAAGPCEGRDAEDSHSARGRHDQREAQPSVTASLVVDVAQREHEAEQEQREQRLFEGALREVGDGEVGDPRQRGRRQAQVPPDAAERPERRQRDQDRHGEQDAREGRRGADAEPDVQDGGDRVRAVGVPRRRDVRGRADRREGLGLAHVEGEVVVDPRPELADAVVGDERQRADREDGAADREPGRQRDQRHPAPYEDHDGGDRGERRRRSPPSSRDRAGARSPAPAASAHARPTGGAVQDHSRRAAAKRGSGGDRGRADRQRAQVGGHARIVPAGAAARQLRERACRSGAVSARGSTREALRRLRAACRSGRAGRGAWSAGRSGAGDRWRTPPRRAARSPAPPCCARRAARRPRPRCAAQRAGASSS